MANDYYNRKLANKYSDYQVKQPTTLLEFLINCVPGTTRTKAKKLLGMKMVFIDKVITTQFDTPLKPGQLVQIAQKGNQHELKNKFVKLVYEDAFIIVVEKQPGIVSVPMPGTKEVSVKSVLNDYIKKTNRRFTVHTVHRLDKGTSGLMMFAKKREVQQVLIDNWKDIVRDRRYVAVVDGILEKDKGTIASWLDKDRRYVIMSSPVDNGGQYAVTHYRTIQKNNNLSLVELNLETGRTNQIRVHMCELKHPVLGDDKYGCKNNPLKRLCLHAYKLFFIHPVTGELLKFETPIPPDFTKLLK